MTVQENQSLFDIAVQEDGSVLAVFGWAVANGISITDDLTPGQKLISPNSNFRNVDMGNYFKNKNQSIATGFNETNNDLTPELGIGSMKIGTTFIVR